MYLDNDKNKRHALALWALSVAAMICLAGCSSVKEKPVVIAGKEYPADTRQLTIEEYDADDIAALSGFKQLKKIDVTAPELTAEDYDKLREQLGDKVIIDWTVPVGGRRVKNTAAELTFSGEISAEDADAVKYFSQLQQLTVTDSKVTSHLAKLVATARENNPALSVSCSATAFGMQLKYSVKSLKLNNKKIKNPDDVRSVVTVFPNIRKVEMCGCGVSDENMQALREEFPDVTFIWTIHFLHYTLRTDIQVFSMLAADPSRPGNSETFAPLFRYCTELRALDLGHMRITDISEIRHLKKLHTLILADNSISDISPLAELKELEFVELFCNRIKDVSPLTELPKLEDVNLCYNSAMKNPAAITGCSSLKRLYISNCSLDAEEIAALKKGVPKDCELNYTAPNAVHSGWRTNKNARSVKIREAFANWRKVKAYPAWNKIIYK